jgi:tRNA(Ile)-lysidine synthase TilS/MesJ
LRRDEIDRDFYEDCTRDIRFMIYRKLGTYVFLGHIQEDVVENICTNFAKGRHYQNLAKISLQEKQQGVILCRPFLEITKNEIIDMAQKLGVPFLQNTTPEWSNRGKFRNEFYPHLVKQYGESVDKTLIQGAQILKEQSELLEKFIYLPILDTYHDFSLCISQSLLCDINTQGWTYLLEKICYKQLQIQKPSFSSIQTFAQKMKKSSEGMTEMSKKLKIVVKKEREKYKIKFIIK